jgi:hypothetical protein
VPPVCSTPSIQEAGGPRSPSRVAAVNQSFSQPPHPTKDSFHLLDINGLERLGVNRQLSRSAGLRLTQAILPPSLTLFRGYATGPPSCLLALS